MTLQLVTRVAAPIAFVAASVSISPHVSAAPDACRAVNTRTNTEYLGSDHLQQAFDEVARGDTVRIQGRCIGSYVAYGRMRLIGDPTAAYPHPSLDAAGQTRVLVTSRDVRIYDLTIKNGARVGLGGGIWVERGSLFLGGRTMVIGNSAKVRGGGVDAENGDVTVAGHAVIRGNHSGGYGGGISTGGIGSSVRVIDDAVIRDNTARELGGGIYADNTPVVIGGHAIISGNRAGQYGGGLADYSGQFELKRHASVVRNVAGVKWGGWSGSYSKLRVCGPFVTLKANRPNDAARARIVHC